MDLEMALKELEETAIPALRPHIDAMRRALVGFREAGCACGDPNCHNAERIVAACFLTMAALTMKRLSFEEAHLAGQAGDEMAQAVLDIQNRIRPTQAPAKA